MSAFATRKKQGSKCVGVYQSNKNRQLSVFIEFVVFVFSMSEWLKSNRRHDL